MTMNIETAVGTATKLYFAGTVGIANAASAVVMNGNVTVLSPSLTLLEVSPGYYVLTFTPSASGNYGIFLDNKIVARVEAVQRTTQSILKNLEDEALGSWVWDKNANTLVMTRQDGNLQCY
jgi:hypothetical protein